MDSSHAQMVSLIWSIADDVLRDVFVRGQYRDVILPMVVLRRLDALLEPTKEAVEEEFSYQTREKFTDTGALMEAAGQNYYNTSKWTLGRLKSQATGDKEALHNNFIEYLNGFSPNVGEVLKSFDFYAKARKLTDRDRLLAIIERITDPYLNLTDKPQSDPDGLIIPALTNIGMGGIFEELLRRFNEENNEEAGEHFTPRDVIALLCDLVFSPIKDDLPKIITLYDPACGSGGMLTEGHDYLIDLGVDPSAIRLNGNEVNPETFAICKSDLIIKGVDPEGIHLDNTLVPEDTRIGKQFGFMLTNPPYGKSWGEDKKKMFDEKTLLDERFYVPLPNYIGVVENNASVPRVSDGQMLFMMELVDKMKSLQLQPQGSRAASIHNGSSLFTGDAGSGESNIRRFLVENDMVDAIIQLPNNIFYNTGISTYCWVLTNFKQPQRCGKVQLIDASQASETLRKNQGQRNCEITQTMRGHIIKAYLNFMECEASTDFPVTSKIFDNDDFRYFSVTVLRPLRLRSQMNYEKAEELLFDKGNRELSGWLYDSYGSRVFEGLNDNIMEIREYLQSNDIKLTDKKLRELIDPNKWKSRRALSEIAVRLTDKIGQEVFMDYALFTDRLTTVVSELGILIDKTGLKTIARTMSEADPEAAPVVDKTVKIKSKDIELLTETFNVKPEDLPYYGYYPSGKGSFIHYESDTSLSDKEEVPVSNAVLDYFKREVEPYVSDAWIDLPKTLIGCEISFNKYFYKPAPLRTLAENQQELVTLEKESSRLLVSLLNLG
ncbi:SAM-dependent DNA methyltransferase [Muribaculaceae bacterium Isolate-037 (Harlan)]|uniref:SAM-dependent DNA methyltransferase n=1 Tax=Lepagella muris TaxID=3032870 RepID=A0AC61RCT7_9BACT|nr:SAM-dependent DNA methyltransferase [Muribaculaceae bacterium Isolate-037 (Harlan)]TGY77245.1 SAM-dependent DNA methyltransferase [Lepagella muris]THG49152.1 SAM-dependent DNA methyltransferase [Bacteroidales bacterium]TKC54268.1 SAM-dependent DNA methyltransferase [Bacteroidales bacterium]